LGTGNIRDRKWRPFDEARELVRRLSLKNQTDWRAYCKSGEKPTDIPYSPEKAYNSQFRGWGDWLGTGRRALRSGWRSFEEAREFVRALGLKSQIEWNEWRTSGQKPADIPSTPERTYKGKGWVSLGDWLGTGTIASRKRGYRPFEEAREYVRGLGLRNRDEWEEWLRSGKKPDDIPSSPQVVYKDKGWVSWGDWLGYAGYWTRTALLAFLEALRPGIPYLSERKLYAILAQGGRLSALRKKFGKDDQAIIKDLKENDGRGLEEAIRGSLDEEDESVPAAEDGEALPEGHIFSRELGDALTEDVLPTPISIEALQAVDMLASSRFGLDEEAAEFLVTENSTHLGRQLWTRCCCCRRCRLRGAPRSYHRSANRRWLYSVLALLVLRWPSFVYLLSAL